MAEDYYKLFNVFFEQGSMVSTYKAVFLYALSDIENYNDKSLVGKEWLDVSDDHLIIKLDFIIIRMLKYYWEIAKFGIRHSPERMSNALIPHEDIKIVEEIKNEITVTKQIPPLGILANNNNTEFRKKVINSSLKEVSQKILVDFPNLYKRIPVRKIKCERSLIEFFKLYGNEIRNQLQKKLKTHLEHNNHGKCFTEQLTNTNNPFYLYINNNSLSEIEINELIRNIMQIIKSNPNGIYKSDIIKTLKIPSKTLELIEHKITRVDGIIKKEISYENSILDALFEYKIDTNTSNTITENIDIILERSIVVNEHIHNLYVQFKEKILQICSNIKIVVLKNSINFEIYNEVVVKLLFRKSKIICTFKRHIAELNDQERLLYDISRLNYAGNDQTSIDVYDEKTLKYCIQITEQCYILQTDF